MADTTPQGDFPTVIGPDASFKGELSFEKGLRLQGRFEGKINSPGRLHVACEAKLQADVEGGAIILDRFFPQPEGEPAGWAEPIGIEAGAHLAELAFLERQLPLGISVGIIVEPVVKGLASKLGQKLRVGRQLLVERRVKESVEPGVLGGGIRCRRHRRGRRTLILRNGGRAGGGGEEQGNQQLGRLHVAGPSFEARSS